MKAAQMQKGQTVKIDGKLYSIADFQHVKLGKGGAVYQTRLKSLADGTIQNVRLRSEENVEEAYLDKKTYEYLYSAANQHVLMDVQTYDQITVDDETFGDCAKYLKPNTCLQAGLHEGRVVTMNLPVTVDLEVTDTPPDIRGATATNQNKPATVETGLVVSVPGFVKIKDVIRVDTRTGEYVTRVR